MDETERLKSGAQSGAISRRSLLQGIGATAALTVAAGAAAVPRADIRSWQRTVDVLVIGSGAAGICAGIEARAAGAQVLVIDSLPQFGGSSAMSGGVIYAGGGTSLQRTLGIRDTAADMYDFIVAAGGRHQQLDKVQLYCEQSPAHFDWLVAQGVPYQPKLATAKGLPMGDESLYFSGNEQAWPSRDFSTPAPRGHVPGVKGMNGGRSLMAALLQRARANGVRVQGLIEARQLVVERDGSMAGIVAIVDDKPFAIRARKGIVLASGGFIHNRDMLRRYAPELYDCSVPWGNAGDLGRGINMGIAVGGAALRMHQGFAVAPIYPPENTLSGIVVNASGQRFIAEDSYHAVLGNAIAYHQQGKAWLITDQASAFAQSQDSFLPVAQAASMGSLSEQLGFPRGALQHTVAYYNRHALNGEDPMFKKSAAFLSPLQGPPYTAWDLSVDKAFFPAHTLGGLHTGIDGEVFNSFGEAIPRLFAAGRTTAGLPTAPYAASGLSVGDCTFFGRRAGHNAAAGEVTP